MRTCRLRRVHTFEIPAKSICVILQCLSDDMTLLVIGKTDDIPEYQGPLGTKNTVIFRVCSTLSGVILSDRLCTKAEATTATDGYLSNSEGDAAIGRGEDVEARLVEDLEGPGRDDPVALVPSYHS